MLLSDRDVLTETAEEWIALEPWGPAILQPSSIDIRLDRFSRAFENHRYPHINPAEGQPELTRLIGVGDEKTFVLHPGGFVLGSAWEQVNLPTAVAARLEGRSLLGRPGLLTHSTAGLIDPGFSGCMTLELSDITTLSVKLWPGMKVGQPYFFRFSSEVQHPHGSREYSSHYQSQQGPTPSRFHLNFHRTKA